MRYWNRNLISSTKRPVTESEASGIFDLTSQLVYKSASEWPFPPIPIVSNGLVLHLDAGNSNSYSGSGTTWSDLSGNGNHATLVNGPSFSSSDGGYIHFDGSNDRASISSLDVPDKPFTIAAWVNHDSVNGWRTYAGQDTSMSGAGGALYFQKRNNTNYFAISTRPSDGTSGSVAFSTTTASTNTWFNVCGVASTTAMKIYINGTLEATTNNSTSIAARTGDLLIGAGFYNNNIVDFFDGKISSVLIYDRELSATEVTQNYYSIKSRYGL